MAFEYTMVEWLPGRRNQLQSRHTSSIFVKIETFSRGVTAAVILHEFGNIFDSDRKAYTCRVWPFRFRPCRQKWQRTQNSSHFLKQFRSNKSQTWDWTLSSLSNMYHPVKGLCATLVPSSTYSIVSIPGMCNGFSRIFWRWLEAT